MSDNTEYGKFNIYNPVRFQSVCDNIIHSAHTENGIGTLSEKTVHAILKNYLEPDTSYHEIRTGRCR